LVSSGSVSRIHCGGSQSEVPLELKGGFFFEVCNEALLVPSGNRPSNRGSVGVNVIDNTIIYLLAFLKGFECDSFDDSIVYFSTAKGGSCIHCFFCKNSKYALPFHFSWSHLTSSVF